jgi:hypothetical protein
MGIVYVSRKHKIVKDFDGAVRRLTQNTIFVQRGDALVGSILRSDSV